jgi:hypothetical protein
MRRKTITEIFNSCVVELCNRVNLPFPPKDGEVYEVSAATWTEQEEQNFREWMIKYLGKTSAFKYHSKKRIAEEVEYFLFAYGWNMKGGEQ